jgi:hypothetical protein
MIAEERIYLDKSGKKVVKHNHADCATLLACVGDQIPAPFDKQCKDGRVPGKAIANAPKDLPAITPAKMKAQELANKENMPDENKGSGLQINGKKDKE